MLGKAGIDTSVFKASSTAASEKGRLIEDKPTFQKPSLLKIRWASVLQIGVRIPHFRGYITVPLSRICMLRLYYKQDLDRLKKLYYNVLLPFVIGPSAICIGLSPSCINTMIILGSNHTNGLILQKHYVIYTMVVFICCIFVCFECYMQ